LVSYYCFSLAYNLKPKNVLIDIINQKIFLWKCFFSIRKYLIKPTEYLQLTSNNLNQIFNTVFSNFILCRCAESTRVRVRPYGEIFGKIFYSVRETCWKFPKKSSIEFYSWGIFSQKLCRTGKFFVLAADSARLILCIKFVLRWYFLFIRLILI